MTMKVLSRTIVVTDWFVTLLVSYFLLQFGADRMSRLVTSKYINGNFSEVNGWLTTVGFAALVSMFFLVHPRTRFYTATALAIALGGDSLRSLSLGDPQTLLVPLMGLAAAALVLLSRKPSRNSQSPVFAASPARSMMSTADVTQKASLGAC